MTCRAAAVQCQWRQISHAQASCSAKAAYPARTMLQHVMCVSLPGVCRGSRHQLPVWHGSLHHAQQIRCGASQPDVAESAGDAADDDEVVLTKEEDWTVPGGANDSLSSNTHLGRAVQDACNELETLGGLEQETIEKANELLQKLGYRVTSEQGSDHPASEVP